MRKNDITVSDIFVKKICEKMGEILTKKEITEIWNRSGGSNGRIAYAMSILLGRGVVERVSSGIYKVGMRYEVGSMNKSPALHATIIDKGVQTSLSPPLSGGFQTEIYWQIISKLIQLHAPSGGVIGSEKALEIHLSNYSIPDILIIYTRDTALRIKLSDGREVHFRTLVSGSKTGKKNLWRTIVDNAIGASFPISQQNSPVLHRNSRTSTSIRGAEETIQICGRELALLEALSLRRHDVGIEEANISRFLRSFATSLDRGILGDLTRLRYIRPLNRLRVIARDLGHTELYAMTLEIIRDEGGGCYLNL